MAKRRRAGTGRAKTRRRGPTPARATRPGERRTRAAADRPVVTIRTEAGQGLLEAEVRRDPRIERIAEEWMYILRSRSRWAADPDIRESFRERALDDLESLGVPRAFMKRL